MKAKIIPIASKKEFKPFMVELEVTSLKDAILLFHVSNYTNVKNLLIRNADDYFLGTYHHNFSDNINGPLYTLLKKEIEEQGFTLYKEKDEERDLRYQNAICFIQRTKANHIKFLDYHTDKDVVSIIQWDTVTARNVFHSLERYIIKNKMAGFSTKTCAFCLKNSERFEGSIVNCTNCEYKKNHGDLPCGDNNSFYNRNINRRPLPNSILVEALRVAKEKYGIED
jgi:hypothetical protein